MKIRKFYVDGYKNLTDCEILPSALHTVTGINGSGKSNLLEIFSFIAALITRDDSFRDALLLKGLCPSGGTWFPIPHENDTNIPFFQFKLECEVMIGEIVHLINYSLEIAEAIVGESRYHLNGQGLINNEKVFIKQLGTPGPMKKILSRDSKGLVTINSETGTRTPTSFKTKKNMSAIQALEVREADDFTENFPILNHFKIGLTSSIVIKLNPSAIAYISSNSSYKESEKFLGTPLTSFSLHDAIKDIQKKEIDWKEYNYWLKKLCFIDSIKAYTNSPDNKNAELRKQKMVLIEREKQLLVPHELSTGNLFLLSLVTVLFSLVRTSGVILLEEPETYIHPKAQIDLIHLLRDISEVKTVIFSTHSTVALNSMSNKEVTLMMKSNDSRYTSKAVKEIQEASDAISRGYLSFGDLLQSNFMTE